MLKHIFCSCVRCDNVPCYCPIAPNLTKHHWSSRWRSKLERTPRFRKVGCSKPSRYRPKSFYRVLSRILRVEQYKRGPRVTEVVASKRNLAAQWLWVRSIDKNLQSFTGNSNVSISCRSVDLRS